MELNNDVPALDAQAGDVVGYCLSTGIVYAPPFTGPALAEALWPDEWSILPPG